jgi:hypothetical protein
MRDKISYALGFTMLIILLSAGGFYSGKILPAAIPGISLSLNNKARIAHYTFTFSVETPFITGDTLVITFPVEYNHIKDPADTAGCISQYLAALAQNVSCSVSGQEVTLLNITLNPTLKYHSVVLYNILNPNITGGINPIGIRTMRGQFILDNNEAFEILGFAPDPGK